MRLVYALKRSGIDRQRGHRLEGKNLNDVEVRTALFVVQNKVDVSCKA